MSETICLYSFFFVFANVYEVSFFSFLFLKVTRLLENRDANDVSPVQLIVSNGIYPLLLEYIIKR